MQNAPRASGLSQEGKDLKGVSANQGLMVILNIHYIGVPMVQKTTGTVSLVLGIVQTLNLPRAREAGRGDVT